AGLDPYAGFIHVDRPGKPSLVLDLIEPFRQPVVDRAICALFNQGVAIALDEQHLLTADSRSLIVSKVLARLEKISQFGHLGDARYLGESLAELRWLNGNRIYFTRLESKGQTILLILGGNKNGQSKDIAKARRILKNTQKK
nr:CRISPR-associated endonuclease Cas1 1 [Chlamydiota bacterium]